MMHLLDASVLITADSAFYRFDRVPEYWSWIEHHGNQDRIKIPQETYDEIVVGRGKMVDWLKKKSCREALLINEPISPSLIQHILDTGYAANLTADEIENIGKDPFLVAYAYGRSDRCVVTAEVSRPKAQRQNRRVPDVCNGLGVSWMDDRKILDVLDFRTSWKP